MHGFTSRNKVRLLSDLVEPQLTSDPVHGAGQLHAPRSGAAAQSGRDFFPIEALVAQVNQLALLLLSRCRASSSNSLAATTLLGVGSRPARASSSTPPTVRRLSRR